MLWTIDLANEHDESHQWNFVACLWPGRILHLHLTSSVFYGFLLTLAHCSSTIVSNARYGSEEGHINLQRSVFSCALQHLRLPFVWVPNAAGALLANLQLTLCLAYPKTK